MYAEQYAMGRLTKYKGTCIEIVPNRKIVIGFPFPISLVTPKIEWLIEPKGSNSVFTAVTYMRTYMILGIVFKKIFKKHMERLIESHDKHVGAEGENLKKLLENGNS
ncbi:MAG: hypothetical protein JSV33_16065 [bacterium]|nr:MAG: hypothetical protein JSV33_16065 [bacterium]